MLRNAVSACREHFWLAALLSAVVNLLYLAPTVYMMQVYDRVVPTGGVATLFWTTVIVALALGTLALFDGLRLRVMVRASMRLERVLAEPVLRELIARRAGPGTIGTAQAMREFDTLRSVAGGAPALALVDLPWTPLYVAVAFLLHPLLALLIVLGGGALLALTLLNERRTRAVQTEAADLMAAAYARQDRIAARAETVRALGMGRGLVARQLGERSRALARASRAQMDGGRYVAAARFLRLVLQSLALGAGAWLAIERQISVGAIIAASVLLGRALQPVEQLVGALPALHQARKAWRALSDLLRGSAEDQARTLLPRPTGAIAVRDATVHGAPGTPPVLNGISVNVPAGAMVGIVGPSGAGKSTLARLLSGALLPDEGSVRFDGARIEDWDAEQLSASIGYMPQDNAMLPGTIGENISRFAEAAGTPRAEVDAKVIEAARKAGAHEMILALPGGYDRPLDFGGAGLSAGQQQRVALARALYGNPPVLILDEPNAALDAEGEAALMAAVEEARKAGATILLVAHRAGVLANVDHLLVMNRGSIERFGLKAEVLAALAAQAPGRPKVVGIKPQ